MTDVTPTMDRRLADLERALRRTRWLTACAMTTTVLMAGAAFTDARPKAAAEVRTQRLVVVDEQGQTRVVIGQDATTTQRVSRAAGLTLYDEKGSERGGFSTMSDGSVVLGMDAPARRAPHPHPFHHLRRRHAQDGRPVSVLRKWA